MRPRPPGCARWALRSWSPTSTVCRIISELARCEDELKASGLPWTILKPTFFMQNVMMAAPTVREQRHIYFDWGNGKAGMIDARDVVDCAVGARTGQATAIEGQTFVLTGPAAIGFAEVAANPC